MGRGKIEIKKIENVNSRQVTFSKRRGGLFKKAHELAVLCEAEVGVIIFSNTGKLFEFASSSLKSIFSRYQKCVQTTKGLVDEQVPEKQHSKEVEVLKEEIDKLKLKQQQLFGKDFRGMSLQDLQDLEQELHEGLIRIKEKKEQLLMQELAQTRMEEQRAMLENETLRKQVEELRALLPSTSSPTQPLCFNYYSAARNCSPAIKEDSGSPEAACVGRLADGNSDTTLQLGLPYGNCRKRSTPEGKTHPRTS